MKMRRSRGFTLIELMVVMTIIAILLTIAVPRYLNSAERAKEAVLHSDLFIMREAIDKYYSDRAKYPDALDELVTARYLRNLPQDPVTGSTETWVVVAPEDPAKGAVYDVKSGAEGKAQDGSSYREW